MAGLAGYIPAIIKGKKYICQLLGKPLNPQKKTYLDGGSVGGTFTATSLAYVWWVAFSGCFYLLSLF